MADEKSEGQRLLEQMLAVHDRFRSVALNLEELKKAIGVKASRTPALPPEDSRTSPSKPRQVFFEGLRGLLGNMEALAGELERGVEDLKRTF